MICHRFTRVLTGLSLMWVLVVPGCQKATPPAPVSTNPLPSPQTTPAPPALNHEAPSTQEPTGVPAPASTAASPSTPASAAPITAVAAEGMNVQATAEWDPPYVFGDPPNPLPLPKVEVRLLIEGGPAREIFSMGKLRVNQALTGDRVLRRDLSEYQTTISEMKPIKRMEEPETGVDLRFDYVYPGEPIQSIKSLSGEVDVTFADQTKTFTGIKVGELPELAEKEPLLKAIGFSIAPPRVNSLDEMDYILTTGPAGVVSNFEVKDGEGNNSFDFGSGDFPLTGGCRYEASFNEDEIKNSTVSFTVATGLRRVTIPFTFQDIPVAEFKKRTSNQVDLPSPELGKASIYYPSETTPELPKGLRADGRLGWSLLYDWQHHNAVSNPILPAAFVELSGPLARTIRKVESVDVTQCLTDGGELRFRPPGEFYDSVFSRDSIRVLVPEGAPVSAKLPFESPENPVQLCKELSGMVSVVLTEAEETVEFELDDAEGPLEHPTLKKMGMTARYQIQVPEDPTEEDQMSLKVVISMPDREHLGRLFLSSAVDKSFLISYGDKSDDGGIEFSTSFHAGKHPTPRLVFDLVTQFKREKVPFRFLNLPVSAPLPAKP